MKTGATAREATATEATAATATEATAAVLALVVALGLGPKRASIETRMMMSLVNYMTCMIISLVLPRYWQLKKPSGLDRTRHLLRPE